jgi:2-polyprenyl-3-methyl-5-hydroxy-6-metoxy-1,4-benzoquinol methylase
MEDRIRALLACPACGSALDANWRCEGCDARYAAPDGIPDLRLPGTNLTETVRTFYSAAPFPGYPPNDSLAWLRARAQRSRFAQLLDEAIPGDARIVEIGCGTGQMSIYLARADRVVIGADLTRASLLLAAAAAKRFAVDKAFFVETDLANPGLRPAAFDIVYCSGVLHHTADPRESFRRIAKLVRPGGMIVIGLYNAIARIPLRLRRAAARLTKERWIPHDSVLDDRATEPARREAWLRDQYHHPEEHRHTLAEVRRWFAENGIEYVRTFPTALLGPESKNLFASEADGWWLEDWLAQIGWTKSLGDEGGLFVSVGRRHCASTATSVCDPLSKANGGFRASRSAA